mmetsp:Transcript_96235/g.170897  ORF Transcript_96235/g.170897 Transcript_96235/m.170897 type:complete len:431 (-) Transcript_96235:55-1347(-)
MICCENESSSGSGDTDSDADSLLLEVASPGLRREHRSPTDTSAGTDAFAIPGAFGTLDITGARQVEPPKMNDLTSVVLPGDIVNILGGNVWGHCGMITNISAVLQFPVLLDMIPADKHTGKEAKVEHLDFDVHVFMLDVMQSASNMPDIFISQLAVVVHPDTKEVCLVKRVQSGLAIMLRRSHSGNPMIVEILMSPFSKDTLNFELFQHVANEVMTAPQNNNWSKRTAVRAFLRHAELKPTKHRSERSRLNLATALESCWKARPVCSTVPPRIWQRYLKARSEEPRAPLPSMNLAGVKVQRGKGTDAHLLHCGRSLGAESGMETDSSETENGQNCFATDICSSTADGRCGPSNGMQCKDCKQAQWSLPSDHPDPRIAFVEDVLRLMPLKDDRALPEELCTCLVATGYWTRLDMRRRAPAHRRTHRKSVTI